MGRTVMPKAEVHISLTQGRCASLRVAAVLLATTCMTWASEIKASADQERQLADTQQAATARNLGSKDFETPLFRPRSNDESIRGAQTTTNDTRAPHRPPEQQRGWAESLSCELALARRDIELLQHLEQEHDRAERLAQSVDAARREIESQTAFAAKAIEEASRLKEVS